MAQTSIEYPQSNLESILKNFSRKNLEVLPHGVIVIKKCLSEEQQLAVLQVSMTIASQRGNADLLPRQAYQSSSKKAVPILFYNWPAKPLSRSIEPPTELLNFASTIFLLASQHSQNLITDQNTISEPRFRCPTNYGLFAKVNLLISADPNGLYAIMYPHGGKFGAHLDGAQGWVMSISIGESAKFFWSASLHGKREYLQIDSGDIVLFNGGLLYHGIEEIIPDSAPKFWTQPQCPMSVFQMGRFSLQFRDPAQDTLTYNPQFPEEGTAYEGQLEFKMNKSFSAKI